MCLSPLSLKFLDLFRRDPNGPVVRNAGAGEQRGEQIALISLRICEVASGPDRTAALSGNHKGEVFTSVNVPILQPDPHIMMQLSSNVPSPSRRFAIFVTM